MKMVVALFNINTQTIQNLDAASRVGYVCVAVIKAWEYVQGLGEDFWKDTPGMRAIFLSPEYCFARSVPSPFGNHGFGQKRQMEEDYVKNTLRPLFGQLSDSFKNALIVPGTVAWRKSIMPATGNRGDSPQEIADHRLDKYTDRLMSTKDTNLFFRSNASDPGNYPFSYNTTPFPSAFKRPDDTRPGLPTLGDKILQLQTAHYIAKNTAHCFYNGDPVYNYNKIGDFYEVSEDDPDTINMPNRSTVSGTESGPGRFTVAGLDFGISICYDQSLSVQDVAQWTITPLQKTAAPVDFHILLSAHIPPDLSAANLKNGGYLLSCSSAKECNKVIHSTGGEIPRDHKVKIDGVHNLFLYKIDV